MGYKLKKREYDYNESLFKKLGIETQEVEGRNFLEISNIITKKYRELARKSHSDKVGGSDEKMQAINGHKAELLKYIKPLSTGGSLILTEEQQRYTQLMPQDNINWDDKHIKYASAFGLVSLLLGISLLASYIYLGVRLFKAANFTNTPGILFSATLFTAVSTFLLTTYFISSVVKKAMDLQDASQKQGENLDQEALKEEIFRDRKYKFLIYTCQYAPYLSCTLLVAGLASQYQSGCVDSKVLIGFVAVLGCMLIGKLATEIYERKVVNLVEGEGRDAERKVPVGALQEAGPSSVVDSGSAFNASAHGVV